MGEFPCIVEKSIQGNVLNLTEVQILFHVFILAVEFKPGIEFECYIADEAARPTPHGQGNFL